MEEPEQAGSVCVSSALVQTHGAVCKVVVCHPVAFNNAPRNTWQEAQAVRTLMQANGLKSVLKVTLPWIGSNLIFS
jgi:hypothetical protein